VNLRLVTKRYHVRPRFEPSQILLLKATLLIGALLAILYPLSSILYNKEERVCREHTQSDTLIGSSAHNSDTFTRAGDRVAAVSSEILCQVLRRCSDGKRVPAIDSGSELLLQAPAHVAVCTMLPCPKCPILCPVLYVLNPSSDLQSFAKSMSLHDIFFIL